MKIPMHRSVGTVRLMQQLQMYLTPARLNQHREPLFELSKNENNLLILQERSTQSTKNQALTSPEFTAHETVTVATYLAVLIFP